jgi:hypothetical protein
MLTFDFNNILEIQKSTLQNTAEKLEDGEILFFPNLKFELKKAEERFLSPDALNLKVKSIKYDPKTQRVWGVEEDEIKVQMQDLIGRYSTFATSLIEAILPEYKGKFSVGNTSFRPVEASGRKQSKRHDDTRLHIDSFPSRPTAGKRLLRVFANVNLEGKPRIWNSGETFEEVAKRFLPKILPPLPLLRNLMQMLKITKSFRTEYDHYMLNLHDKMKLDEEYQKSVKKDLLEFTAGSVWVCFSDKVSHAAISGRGLLEQTIYLNPKDVAFPEKSLFIFYRKC